MGELIVVLSFALVMLILIGGFWVTYPVTRRLGSYLERLIEEKRNGADAASRIESLQAELLDLQEEVRLLAEHQAFSQSLLADREKSPRLTAARSRPDDF
ncbi:MAG: hypothetical protein WD960_07030 [Gemmatimonadota bacterium]